MASLLFCTSRSFLRFQQLDAKTFRGDCHLDIFFQLIEIGDALDTPLQLHFEPCHVLLGQFHRRTVPIFVQIESAAMLRLPLAEGHRHRTALATQPVALPVAGAPHLPGRVPPRRAPDAR